MKKTRLPIAQISPGMKLAEPLTNTSGITLMPAGIRLTPMFIARLQKWNIEAVDVFVEIKGDDSAGGDVVENAAASPAKTEEKEYTLTAEQAAFAKTVATEISRTFVNVRDNPLMMQLRAIAIKRLILHGPEGVINLLRQPQVRPTVSGEATA